MLKKFKIGLPFLALMLGVAASAFIPPGDQKDPEYKFWRIIDPTHPEDPSNYEEIDATTFNSLNCEGSQTVCKMKAQVDATTGEPVFNVGQDNLPIQDGNLVLQRSLKNQ